MEPDKHLHIWTEVANGRGNHGDFLKSFADAFMRADFANVYILRSASEQLIEKYELSRYLDNFPSTDGFPPDPEPDPEKRRSA